MSEMGKAMFLKCTFCGFLFPPQDFCDQCGQIAPKDPATEYDLPVEQPVMEVDDQKFRFIEAGNIDHSYQNLDPTKYALPIRSCVVSFMRNMERSNGIMALAFYFVGQSITNQHAVSQSQFSGQPPNEILELMSKVLFMPRRFAFLGRNNIDKMLAANPDGTQSGAESMLASQVIAAWTAYEALVEDLWIHCLNARPRLGFLALDAEPTEDDSEEDAEKKRKKRVLIPTKLLRKPDFKPCEQMGDILTTMRKFDFSRRNEAHDAYKKVFETESEKFKPYFRNNELQWLAAVRNNLVHSAGIADSEFLGLVRGHPILNSVSLKQQIPLTGDIVASLVNAAIENGKRLINFVDTWLEANPA